MNRAHPAGKEGTFCVKGEVAVSLVGLGAPRSLLEEAAEAEEEERQLKWLLLYTS